MVQKAHVIGDLKALEALLDGLRQLGHGLLIGGVHKSFLVGYGEVVVHVMIDTSLKAPFPDALDQGGLARVFRADCNDPHVKLLFEWPFCPMQGRKALVRPASFVVHKDSCSPVHWRRAAFNPSRCTAARFSSGHLVGVSKIHAREACRSST